MKAAHGIKALPEIGDLVKKRVAWKKERQDTLKRKIAMVGS